MIYNIYLCRKCGQPCACKANSKTFTCAFCGTRNDASKSVRVASGISSADVPSMIAQLKAGSARKGQPLKIKRD